MHFKLEFVKDKI